MTHDPLCPVARGHRMPDATWCLWCDVIARVRADERKRGRGSQALANDRVVALADLRAKVEALPSVGYIAAVWRADVLALIDGSSDA